MLDLTKYRLESAAERLATSKLLLESGCYKDSINRSYYAIFTAIRALLSTRNVEFSKHSGVIGYFQKEYVKTGIFDKKFSKYLKSAFQIRQDCDYEDFFIAAKQDAEAQYIHAAELLDTIREYLDAEEDS